MVFNLICQRKIIADFLFPLFNNVLRSLFILVVKVTCIVFYSKAWASSYRFELNIYLRVVKQNRFFQLDLVRFASILLVAETYYKRQKTICKKHTPLSNYINQFLLNFS